MNNQKIIESVYFELIEAIQLFKNHQITITELLNNIELSSAELWALLLELNKEAE